MKNTEIRIGNYVYRNDILVTVDEQTFWDMKNNPEQYKPVPLTEHWLEKFGFEKIHEYEPHDSYDYLKGFGDLDASGLWRNGKLVGVHVECVNYFVHDAHQLQNLYFALTNQELKA